MDKECWIINAGRKCRAEIVKFDGYFYTLRIQHGNCGEAVIRLPKGKVFLSEESATEFLVGRNRYKKHFPQDWQF